MLIKCFRSSWFPSFSEPKKSFLFLVMCVCDYFYIAQPRPSQPEHTQINYLNGKKIYSIIYIFDPQIQVDHLNVLCNALNIWIMKFPVMKDLDFKWFCSAFFPFFFFLNSLSCPHVRLSFLFSKWTVIIRCSSNM